MAVFSINNITVSGVAACVPTRAESNLDYDWIASEERQLLVKTTGVLHRRIAEEGILASDICCEAAKKLFTDTGTDPSEIEIVVFVSQSRDYLLPSSAIILQSRLGLPKTAMAFDVPLGCSGYVYGLSVVAGMMSIAGLKRGLLLAGDTSSLSLNRKDKSAYPLFGDGGSATLLEHKAGAKMDFNLQSDGKNFSPIIIPHGGARRQIDAESDLEEELEQGVIRKKRNLWLNGFDIFNFSVTEVPPNIRSLLAYANIGIDDLDYFVMHQANLLLNETIRKKMKIHEDKTPYSLKDYGNTSSASIPLTMAANLKNKLGGRKKLLLAGFGVGLSWGSAIIDTDNLSVSSIVEI